MVDLEAALIAVYVGSIAMAFGIYFGAMSQTGKVGRQEKKERQLVLHTINKEAKKLLEDSESIDVETISKWRNELISIQRPKWALQNVLLWIFLVIITSFFGIASMVFGIVPSDLTPAQMQRVIFGFFLLGFVGIGYHMYILSRWLWKTEFEEEQDEEEVS